jgi:hypothetical protein
MEADAEKVCRFFRYALTRMQTCGQAVAQRGVDRPPSDSLRSKEGGVSHQQMNVIWVILSTLRVIIPL